MSRWESDFEKRPVRTGTSFGMAAAIGLVAIVAVGGAGFGVLNLLAQPARVVQRTFDADNMIYNYEWFRQQFQDVQAMDQRIADFEAERASATGAERDRIASIVMGLRSKRAQMVADYNARGQMANRSIFAAGLSSQIQ